MRRNYDVIVTRDTTESCTMVIEAANSSDAELAALERARADEDLVWEQDDTPNASKHPYVTDIQETL